MGKRNYIVEIPMIFCDFCDIEGRNTQIYNCDFCDKDVCTSCATEIKLHSGNLYLCPKCSKKDLSEYIKIDNEINLMYHKIEELACKKQKIIEEINKKEVK
jgi:hypothetical protein